MAKVRISMIADDGALFDALHKVNGEAGGLGAKVAGVILSHDVNMLDAVGLAYYGITDVKIEIDATTPAGES